MLLSGHFEESPRSKDSQATVDQQRHCCLQVGSHQSCNKCNRGKVLLDSHMNQDRASIKNVASMFQPSHDFEHM